jgi:SAM-dependent methyltransferase
MSFTADAHCSHPESEPLYGGLLTQCRACGLVSTASEPTFDYREAYFTAQGQGGYDFDSPFAQAFDAARFQAELRRQEATGLEKSVLDVGCATGSYLVHAQRRGWAVAGAELSEYARGVASKRLGVPIHGALDQLPAGVRYPLVTLHHVLEHIPGPLAFLRDQIRPRVGTRLLLEVPNFEALASQVHGPHWRDLRPDQHLNHFTRRTLPPLVEEAGFRVLAAYTLWEPLWSLRTGADLLGLLPGLVRAPRHGAPQPLPPASVSNVEDFTAPRGARRVAVEASRLLFRPLVAGLEAAGLGDRLVVEAEPTDVAPAGRAG